MSFPGMQYQRLYYTGNRCCSQGKTWVLAVGDIAGDCHNDNGSCVEQLKTHLRQRPLELHRRTGTWGEGGWLVTLAKLTQ